MSLLTTIAAANDLKVEAVEVPEWGTTLHLKTMSGKLREQCFATWDKYVEDNKLPKPSKDEKDDKGADSTHFQAVYLVHSLCDENGVLPLDMSLVPVLREKSPATLAKLFDAAVKLNRVGSAAVEDASKNS